MQACCKVAHACTRHLLLQRELLSRLEQGLQAPLDVVKLLLAQALRLDTPHTLL
jgi:hypothetical protein